MLARLIGTVRTIEDVISTMRAIHETLPDSDGVKWFNFLYLNVTEAVLADTSVWEDWPFLQRFDVTFAILYFDAIVNWEQDRARTPLRVAAAVEGALPVRARTNSVRARRHECAHQPRSRDRARPHGGTRRPLSFTRWRPLH